MVWCVLVCSVVAVEPAGRQSALRVVSTSARRQQIEMLLVSHTLLTRFLLVLLCWPLCAACELSCRFAAWWCCSACVEDWLQHWRVRVCDGCSSRQFYGERARFMKRASERCARVSNAISFWRVVAANWTVWALSGEFSNSIISFGWRWILLVVWCVWVWCGYIGGIGFIYVLVDGYVYRVWSFAVARDFFWLGLCRAER